MTKHPPNRRGISFEVGAQLEARDRLKNWYIYLFFCLLLLLLLIKSFSQGFLPALVKSGSLGFYVVFSCSLTLGRWKETCLEGENVLSLCCSDSCVGGPSCVTLVIFVPLFACLSEGVRENEAYVAAGKRIVNSGNSLALGCLSGRSREKN